VLEGIGSPGQSLRLDPDEGWPGSRRDWFLCQFVTTVAGDRASIADAIARRAATATAEQVLADPAVGEAIDRGDSRIRISDGLFCTIYRFFFADYVTEFVKAVIAEKVKLTVPALVLIDPTGQIADWVAGKVMSFIPTPCEEKQQHPEEGRSVGDLARSMLRQTVLTALGLDEGPA